MEIGKEGQIGNVGSYDLEVSAKGVATAKASVEIGEAGLKPVKASVMVEVDVVVALEILAKKSDNKVDDAIVAMVKNALGR